MTATPSSDRIAGNKFSAIVIALMIGTNSNDRWQFGSFYYESEYFGGNNGQETCIMR